MTDQSNEIFRIRADQGLELLDGPMTILKDQKNLVMPLREYERIGLKESIAQVGVQVPVIVSLAPTRGRIIDGANRWDICRELGMPCPITFRSYKDTVEEDKAALGLNVQRRQLDDLSAGMINIKLLEIYGITGRGRKSLSGLSVGDVAREAGQSERTFYRRVEMARLLSRPDCLDIMEAYRKEELTNQEALTLARERKKAAEGGGTPPQPRKGQTLKDMVNDLKRGPQISPLDQARMEAFTEGVKWGHDAVSDKAADPDWVLQQLQDWRQSVEDRERAEARQKQESTP